MTRLSLLRWPRCVGILPCRSIYTQFIQHVGIRRYSQFLQEVYDLLEDDGVFVFQVAGIRPHWQYEDLVW
jgi:hypothetical protein